MEGAAKAARLLTKSTARTTSRVRIVNRIAVEELEAWFLGDPDAVRIAYPRVSGTFERRAAYRHPDAVSGGTWEALERLLQRAGYFPGGLAKIATASAIAEHMAPDRNRSPSFAMFRRALTELVGA